MKKLLFISALMALTAMGFAQYDMFDQTAQGPVKKISLSLVPHYILFNGLRVDYEYQNNKKAYVFAPQLYFVSRQTHPITYGDADLYKLYGAGLGIYRKFIRSTNYNLTGYLAAGAVYNFFYTQFREFLPVEQTLYDNTVYVYQMQNLTGAIHRFEVNATLGIQNNLPIGLMIEGYLGIGYRYSMPFFSQNIANPFDKAFDYAYTGPIFITGIKIGFSKNLSPASSY